MILFVANALSKKGRSIVYTEFLVSKLEGKLPVKIISSKKNKAARLLDVAKFILFNQRKINVVVIDTFSTSAFYYALWTVMICLLLRIDYVLVLHGGNLPARYQKSEKIFSWILKRAKTIVAPSHYLYEFFTRRNFRVKIILNAIEIKNYSFSAKKLISPRILWVRSFDYVYNPIMAVKTLKVLLEEFPEATLTMVGPTKDGSFDDCKNFVIEHGMENHVAFTGLLPKREWVELAGEFDLFINTTNIDNQPVSVIEAMALGLIVISTNVGGIPFLIKDEVNGYLVEADDHVTMASIIASCIKKGDHSTLESARKIAETYDWENIEKEWLELLSV